MSYFKKVLDWLRGEDVDETHSLSLQHHASDASPGTWHPSDLVFVYRGPKKRAERIKEMIENIMADSEVVTE